MTPMRRIAGSKLSQIFPAVGSGGRLALRNDLHLVRKLWHMSMGLVVVAIFLGLNLSRPVAVQILGSLLGCSLLMETARLKSRVLNEKIVRIWGPLMRTSEVDRLSGIPFYLASCLLAVAIFPKMIAALSILYLAVGDPVASLFGILWGKKSLRMPNGKSLIGTSAGIFACMAVSFLFLRSQGLPEHQVNLLTLLGGLAGGTAELMPLEVDDNFSIPVVSGFALWFVFILLNF